MNWAREPAHDLVAEFNPVCRLGRPGFVGSPDLPGPAACRRAVVAANRLVHNGNCPGPLAAQGPPAEPVRLT